MNVEGYKKNAKGEKIPEGYEKIEVEKWFV